MRHINKNTVFIFSAENSRLSTIENERLNKQMMFILQSKNIAFKVVSGHYRGCNEVSFVVVNQEQKEIMEITNRFNQECILRVDTENNACLLYPDSESTFIGKFKSVDKSVALQKDSYTYCPLNKAYYIAE